MGKNEGYPGAPDGLSRSEARAQTVLDTVADAIITIDQRGLIQSINPAAERMFGYRPDECIGQNVKLLMPSPYQEEHDQYLKNYNDTGERKIIGLGREVEAMRKDGTVFPIDLLVGEAQVDGEPIFTGIIRDISDRKQAEDKLRLVNAQQNKLLARLSLSESRARAILETAADAIITIDQWGLIQSINPAAERMFGYRPAECIGQNVKLLMPSPYAEEHDQYIKNYNDTGEKKIIGLGREVEAMHKDGTVFPIDLLVGEAEIEGEKVFTGIVRDITERKEAERQLYAMNENLQQSNRDLEQFAYVASHDLQEPLRMVASYTQLLEKRYGDKLDQAAKEFIDFSVDGAKRMQRLINDLLLFSRVNTEAKTFAEVDLNTVYDGVINDLGAAIEESAVAVRRDDLPTVQGDETQLRQLLQNLIGNAIKYRDQDKHSHVQVSANRHGGRWQVCVEDNGIGFSEEFKERIFIIFQRLHGKSEYSGTGIGLAVCKRIVERHSGEIWVESAPGQGSRFFFTLPA